MILSFLQFLWPRLPQDLNPLSAPPFLASHYHISHIHATCNPGDPVLALTPQADSLVGMWLKAQAAGGWALPQDPAQHVLSISGGSQGPAEGLDGVGLMIRPTHSAPTYTTPFLS